MNYSTIWRLRTGKQKPTWSTLEKMLKLTNGAVTANDWVLLTAIRRGKLKSGRVRGEDAGAE